MPKHDKQSETPKTDQPGVALIVSPFVKHSLLPDAPEKRPVCSWPLDTAKGRARLHQVIAGNTDTLWDMCAITPVEIVVSDLAAHFSSWESPERPGELIAGPMLSLIGPEGIWHTGSPGALESIRQLILLEEAPPWNPPILLRISRATTRNKNTRMVVEYVDRVTY